MRQHAGTAVRRGALHIVHAAALVAFLVLALVGPVPSPDAATAAAGGPPGNNGTVKIAELGDIDDPDNDPHVGCTFTVEWYGFDLGPDIISTVAFESWEPTGAAVLQVEGPSQVFVGGDPAGGAGTATGLDGREVYTLAFHGTPAAQGFHVKLTVDTPGSQGADGKSKVFWVEGCEPPTPSAPAIHLEKTVTDADASGDAALGELLSYAFRVTNTGSTVLTDVTISDEMLGLVQAPCVAGLAPGASTACPLLPPRTHVVTAADVAAGSVSNVATVTGTPPSGPDVSDADDALVPTEGGGPEPATLALVKTVSAAIAAPGDQVSYALRVVNTGAGPAKDVVVTDQLPSGTTYLSGSAGCLASAGTVTCSLATVPAGGDATATITVRVDALPATVTGHDHQLDVTKIESHLPVQGGDTAGATTTCPTGYLATDGSVRLDHVDQGTGTFADAMVLRSETTSDGRGWAGTIRNDTTGQLQAKVNVVCASDRTVSGEDHAHPLVVSDSLSTTEAYAAGEHTVDLACGPGTVAIAPGFGFHSGDGVVTSTPIANGRHFRVRMAEDGQVTLTTRCLRTTLGVVLGHTHPLAVTEQVGRAVVEPHGIVERSLTCRDGAKGVVAWVDHDGQPLGNDPQPVTRVFRFHNPTSAPLAVDYGLTCIDVRTASGEGPRQIDNTARVTTSSHDTTAYDDVSTATITVTPTGVAAAASGSVVDRGTAVALRVSGGDLGPVRLSVVATGRVAGSQVRAGTVLAQGQARVRGTEKVVRLPATRVGRAALRAGKVDRARLVVVAGGKREARPIRLR